MNDVKCIQESAAEDVICIPVLAFPKASKIGLAETILHKRIRVRVGVSRRDRVRMPFVQLQLAVVQDGSETN